MWRFIRADGFIPPLVPLLSWLTARYIARQRRRVLPYTEPIAARFCSEFRPFFPPEILGGTRLAHASVPNPRFYSLVRLLGIRGVLEMSAIGAITLVDVIAYPEKMNRSILFHELVHAVQYRVLGLRQFARLYVTGFLNGGGYEGIPLERQAYELEERFSRDPKSPFSVEIDVQERLRAGRL
jgi:hypothetical protein